MIFPALILVAAWSIGGAPVDVSCGTVSDWAKDPGVVAIQAAYGYEPGAYARVRERQIRLGWYACGGAALLVADPRNETGIANEDDYRKREAYGLFALLHEGAHVSGIADEHAADCFALGRMPSALDHIGVPREDAAALVGIAQAIHDDLGGEYSGPCP